MSPRQKLLHLLREHAVRWGDFTLRSGARSNHYIDVKRALCRAEVARLTGSLLFSLTHDLDFTLIGGPAVGAVAPMMAAVASYHALDPGREIRGFFVRKTGTVEGEFTPGERAVIVEDVVTTGHSLDGAVKMVQDAGVQVVAAVCVVDRCEGAKGVFAGRFPFRSLFWADELIAEQKGG